MSSYCKRVYDEKMQETLSKFILKTGRSDLPVIEDENLSNHQINPNYYFQRGSPALFLPANPASRKWKSAPATGLVQSAVDAPE